MYFVWLHQVVWAVVSLAVFWAIAQLVVWGKNEEAYAKTRMGRYALSHLAPWSAVWHIAGYVLLVYSFWINSVFYILVAVTLIGIGHLRDKSTR